MSDKEKRRSGAAPPAQGPSPPGSGPSGPGSGPSGPRTDSDRDFLSQAGVAELLRGAILKMVEARTDDPIGFLADHFCNLASSSPTTDSPGTGAGTGGSGDGEQLNNGPVSAGAQEQQRLNRALWHLRLAHHSQRSAFSNNVRVAYDLLNLPGPRRLEAPEGPEESTGSPVEGGVRGVGGVRVAGGGVRGGLYTQTLECVCSEGGVPASTAAPLLHRLHCQDHEAVPYDVFRHGVLTVAVFSDFIRQAQRLYAEACCPDDGAPPSRALGHAVLGALGDALENAGGAKATRYLEASAQISPCRLSRAMARARGPGAHMDAKEFENAAAELFIARVKVVT